MFEKKPGSASLFKRIVFEKSPCKSSTKIITLNRQPKNESSWTHSSTSLISSSSHISLTSSTNHPLFKGVFKYLLGSNPIRPSMISCSTRVGESTSRSSARKYSGMMAECRCCRRADRRTGVIILRFICLLSLVEK